MSTTETCKLEHPLPQIIAQHYLTAKNGISDIGAASTCARTGQAVIGLTRITVREKSHQCRRHHYK